MTSSVTDLNPVYKVMNTGVIDLASDKERQNGIHDLRRFKCYPAYPWKNDGRDHFLEDQRAFFEICERSGLVKHMRKEDMQKERTMTYSEWAATHPDNNIAKLLTKKI